MEGGVDRAASPVRARQCRQGRRSDPPTATTVARNDALVGLGFGVTQPLDVVNEGAEIIHGYYGPRDQAVGQTAAGLDITQDLSSPVNAVQRWEGFPLPSIPPPPGPEERR